MAALGSDDRVQIYATLVRQLAEFERQQWTEIVVLSQLCDEAGQGLDAPETCLDRLTDVEQSQIASQLVDLAPLVRFVNANVNQFEIEWTEPEPHLLVRLGPIEAANGQVHVGADMACGGTCGGGAELRPRTRIRCLGSHRPGGRIRRVMNGVNTKVGQQVPDRQFHAQRVCRRIWCPVTGLQVSRTYSRWWRRPVDSHGLGGRRRRVLGLARGARGD